MQMLIQRKP